MTIEVLKLEAIKLERLQRIDFIRFLLESLAREEEQEQQEFFEVTEHQQKEIERRIQATKNGTVKTVPSAQVEARIRTRHGF